MMKTLKDHTIIYDHECPMCKLYTGAFVKHRFLENGGRKSFEELSEGEWKQLDTERSFNEIPLINTKSGEITYGIESLLKIISHRFSFLGVLFRAVWFRWFVKRLYSFVSYNRKVIIPGKRFEKDDQCSPSFSWKYRIAYLIFAMVLTTVVLAQFSVLLPAELIHSGIWTESLVSLGQLVVMGAISGVFSSDKTIYYLGNLMTVSLMGSLMLVPVILVAKLIQIPELILIGYFMMVVTCMFLEHKRRLEILGMSTILYSISWVIYRLIALMILLS